MRVEGLNGVGGLGFSPPPPHPLPGFGGSLKKFRACEPCDFAGFVCLGFIFVARLFLAACGVRAARLPAFVHVVVTSAVTAGPRAHLHLRTRMRAHARASGPTSGPQGHSK